MYPDRQYIAKDGTKVSEYYWGGKYCVYIGNIATDKTFNQLVDEYELAQQKETTT